MTKMFGSRLMLPRDRAEISWGVELLVARIPKSLQISSTGVVGSSFAGNYSKLMAQI